MAQQVYHNEVTDRIMYLRIVIGKQVFTFLAAYAPPAGP